MSEQEKILRVSSVEKITGYSRATIRRLERAGQFPPRRQLGARAVGWLESEVQGWVRAKSTGLYLAGSLAGGHNGK